MKGEGEPDRRGGGRGGERSSGTVEGWALSCRFGRREGEITRPRVARRYASADILLSPCHDLPRLTLRGVCRISLREQRLVGGRVDEREREPGDRGESRGGHAEERGWEEGGGRGRVEEGRCCQFGTGGEIIFISLRCFSTVLTSTRNNAPNCLKPRKRGVDARFSGEYKLRPSLPKKVRGVTRRTIVRGRHRAD